MSDLLIRLRVMARLTGRDDDADTAAEAAREIKRLGLTDAEREAINVARIELNTLHCFEDHYSHILKNLLVRLA